MSAEDLTLEEFEAAAAAVVAERGEDFVYPAAVNGGSCNYSPVGDIPSCLIGEILKQYAPAAYEAFVAHEIENGSFAVSDIPYGPKYNLDFPEFPSTDPAVLARADMMQGLQDAGCTWGEAIAK